MIIRDKIIIYTAVMVQPYYYNTHKLFQHVICTDYRINYEHQRSNHKNYLSSNTVESLCITEVDTHLKVIVFNGAFVEEK